MRRLALVLTVLLAATVVAAPAFAAGNRVNVPRKFKKVLPKTKADSGIAVRLPKYVNVGTIKPRRVFGKLVDARPGRYELDLGIGKSCNGSNACAIGFFFGERGAKKTNKVKVKLARGITGRYRKSTCAASCSPVSIQWKQKRVLYEIQLRSTKRQVVKAANSAIKGGPR